MGESNRRDQDGLANNAKGGSRQAEGIFDSDQSMRSDATLIQSLHKSFDDSTSTVVAAEEAGSSFVGVEPYRQPASEAILCGSPGQAGYSIAVGTASYELYQPTPRPGTSFSQNTDDHFQNVHLAPHSPALSDTTFREVTSSALGHSTYPLTQLTRGTGPKMDTPRSAAAQSGFNTSSTATLASADGAHNGGRKKDWRFWMIFGSLMVVCILTALDMTMISTALPGIVRDLPVSDISGTWITSSYLLTMTASQPAFGGLSCVAGRRWSITLAVLIFLAGSVGCALAPSMFGLAVARGLQGLGGGGIQALCEIIASDLTTLKERGFFVGLVGLVFAVASFVAPVLGGIFSSSNWRWIFWINLPIGFVSLLMIVPFMKLTTPKMTMREKFERMDLFGNTILFGSVVGILVGTTDGGITRPWSDWEVWLPLALGVVGFFVFLAVEFIPNPLCRAPILPLRLFSNRTAASAFFQTFVHGIVTYGAIYILPIFFQAIKDDSPLRSAINTFPATAPGAPFAIIAGIAMAVTGKYKSSLFIGWAIICIGGGWLTRYQVDTPTWELYASECLAGVGVGTLFAITLPPIQASLPDSELELATATYAFCRSFGSIWGIAVATTIFTSSVARNLEKVPEAAQFGLTGRTALGFVEEIKHLPEPIREPIRRIFADGLQDAMWLFLPLGLIGFISCFFIEELPLPDFIRSQIDIEETKPAKDKAGRHAGDENLSIVEMGFDSTSPTLRHKPSTLDDGPVSPGWCQTREKEPRSTANDAYPYPGQSDLQGCSSFVAAHAVRFADTYDSEGPTVAHSDVDEDSKTSRGSFDDAYRK
ncbi:uncharacterized protein PFL1_01988 [Pseudozyma flocculosa PF-1]|uniref:MFS-type efflux pump MMF1 n=1 Tax=Pseudozyma flocculosa TaxID=84751 RepID=A0A5C3EZ40_9BASI|nr:uncharacterized protein PFL1_01988 [Pseudozyma flocculosa PF-1]EPQ30462.1 hypothetical protein PFL1_01988 [Pseudozyma flocculosa PF-1]SPO37544.1 related to Major Facilitator invovled in MEL transport [Pseudozyma flocculosa]